TSVAAPNGETITYSYNGVFMTLATTTGAVSGGVQRGYDQYFQPSGSTLWVNGNFSDVLFTNDLDGLLKQVTAGAGYEYLTHDPVNGLLTATSLNVVSDALDYDGYGALQDYAASANSAPIFSDQFTTRDNLGTFLKKLRH
ncbi:MAG: RHS repeat protein, partial [Elusimicrobia bacterium]|nr:RHS repeat protein [Elusimicrobiota bacterium]